MIPQQEYEFGWFPRRKYQDLLFYVKIGEHSYIGLFKMPDTQENRAIMDALQSRPAPSAPDCFNDVNDDGTCEHSAESEGGATKPICTIIGKCRHQEIFDRRPVFYQTYCNASQHDATIRNQTLDALERDFKGRYVEDAVAEIRRFQESLRREVPE